MGLGGLYVLVFLGLQMVASERNKGDVTRCWAKGKEVTLRPHQCPAEFDGADAKFCCRFCFGANCCQPRRPRVNLARCPREARLSVADQDYTAAPVPTTPPPPDNFDWAYALISFILIVFVIPICCCCCKWFWKTSWSIWEEELEENRARVNVQSSRVLPLQPLRDIVPDHCPRPYSVLEEDPPPYSLVVSQGTHDLPPPYPGPPLVHPQGAHDLPPPYPGPPVVEFRRSHSHGQDDTVVILPRLVAPPQEAASASAPGAVLPREAVTGSASEVTGLPEAAAYGSASKTVDLLDGGAPDSTE